MIDLTVFEQCDPARFRVPVEIRYADLDPNEHVNHARYLIYLEEARLAFRRHLDRLFGLPASVTWPIAELTIRYRRSASYPGQLTVDYVEGKRVRYLAPFQLLLWLQALTFLAFQLYFNPAAGSSERQSRAVLIIGVFFAVTLALLHLRSGLRFILHFIAALHLWAFLMVLLLAEYILVPWGSVALHKLHLVHGFLPLGLYVTHSVELVMTVYITLALRRIYQSALLVAFFKTLLLLAAYLAFMKLFPFAAL